MGVEGGEDRFRRGGDGDTVNSYIRHLSWSCGSKGGSKEGVKEEKRWKKLVNSQ